MRKIIPLLLILVSCSQLPKVKQKTDPAPEPKLISHVAGAAKPENTDPVKLYSLKELDLPNNHFDLPVVYNKEVAKWIKYFTGRGREWTAKYLNNSTKLSRQFSEIIAQENLPRDLIFLSMAESGFRNDVTSHAQAVGAWQFMRYTGQHYGLEINYLYDERRHPEKSSLAAAKYLKDLYKMFNCWELAMAAYNAGENKIARAIKRYRTTDFWKLTKGSYLKPETKNYVPKIMALAIIGKNLEHYGFEHLEVATKINTTEVTVPKKTDLIKLAASINLDYDTLRQLNPEYIRWHTPLELKEYILKIPQTHQANFNSLDLSDLMASDFQVSPYKKLDKASKHHKVPLAYLKILNPSLEKNEPVILPFHKDHNFKDKMYTDLSFKPKKKKSRRYRRLSSLAPKKSNRLITKAQR